MRRRLFTTEQFYAEGGTRAQLRSKKYTRVDYGVYAEGPDKPDAFESALARLIAARDVAWGEVAGVLHGWDGVVASSIPPRRRTVPVDSTVVDVDGVRCTSPLQTIVDLAEFLEDDEWEQALESGLRRKQFDLADLASLVPMFAKTRRHGSTRIRRVLALRPLGAPPTESLLETLMVQLIREIPGLPPPVRQYEVYDVHGQFVARVDLCWPELGLFIELDGLHHRDQPVYDARRETAVVAATGWLPGRFTWREVVENRQATIRRLEGLVEQARRRPVVSV